MAAPAGAAEANERAHLARLAAFLSTHAWLAQCHTASFFSHRAWCAPLRAAPASRDADERIRDRTEPGWLQALAALPPAALHAVPSGSTQPGWPAELAAFVADAAALSLPRQPCANAPLPHCACAPALAKALAEGVPAKKRHEARRTAASAAHAVLNVHAHVVRRSRRWRRWWRASRAKCAPTPCWT
jgi:hypothetical protein